MDIINKIDMGHYEDGFYEIYQAVKNEGKRIEFDGQIEKMKSQNKHRFKSAKEIWEYAYLRISQKE